MDNAACDGHLRSEDQFLQELIADYGGICVFYDLYLIYTLTQDIHLDLFSYLPYYYPSVAEHMSKESFTTV